VTWTRRHRYNSHTHTAKLTIRANLRAREDFDAFFIGERAGAGRERGGTGVRGLVFERCAAGKGGNALVGQ
jgi:hypothetical protein